MLSNPNFLATLRMEMAPLVAAERISWFLQWAGGFRKSRDVGPFVRVLQTEADRMLYGD